MRISDWGSDVCSSDLRRTAGIAEAEHLRSLVEGLADGVVDRRAEAAIAPDPFHGDELAMTSGDEQQQIRKIDNVRQPRRQRMPFQMEIGRTAFRERRGTSVENQVGAVSLKKNH